MFIVYYYDLFGTHIYTEFLQLYREENKTTYYNTYRN